MTLAERMAAANNRPAGFDYMRLLLATAVILHHSFTVTMSLAHGEAMWATPDRAVIGLILPMFFALSGFLVAGSLERNKSLVSFLGLRAIRLVPALALEVALSALFLGVLLTTLPIQQYFSSPLLRSYFLNIVGDIHYHLPGVFESNPVGFTVNSQLWTIPFELKCYVTLAVLAALGIASRRSLLLCALTLLQIAILATAILHHNGHNQTFPGRVLVGCFLAGLLLFKYRDQVPSNAQLGLASLCLTCLLLLVPYGDYLLCLPAAYATVCLGTINPPRNRLLLSGDYSYGLYLYGFPLQQAFTTLGVWTRIWWIDFACVYPVAFAFAALSWWTVEKPSFKLKKYIIMCETWSLRLPGIAWHSRNMFGMPTRRTGGTM